MYDDVPECGDGRNAEAIAYVAPLIGCDSISFCTRGPKYWFRVVLTVENVTEVQMPRFLPSLLVCTCTPFTFLFPEHP